MTTSLLDEALDGWRFTREGVIAEFENIPARSFDFRPAPDVRSVAELARHIIVSGRLMSGELTRPGGDFTRTSYAQFMKEYGGDLDRRTGKASLIGALRRSHREGEAQIRKAGELRMLQLIVQFSGEPATRLAWMAHGIAHEEYHRGQLTVYARQLGLVPALTQLIQAG